MENSSNTEGMLITYSGKRIRLDGIKAEDICLQDIAHALSMICRFNGHCRRFFSVAQHSLNCSKYLESQRAPLKLQLYGLLHDASEAYIYDLPKPLKVLIPGYEELEKKIQNTIWKAFGLPEPTKEEYGVIKQADVLMLALESKKLMAETLGEDICQPAEINHESEAASAVEQSFTQRARQLLSAADTGLAGEEVT